MFNKDTLKHSLLKKQSLTIISIIAIGSLLGTVYGAGTIITDTGITTTNLTVTGTCTGCGAGEGDYTTYSLLLNTTVTGSMGKIIDQLNVGNDGSILAYDQSANATIVSVSGTILGIGNFDRGTTTGPYQHGQSMTGKFRVIYDEISGYVNIYKNNSLLKQFTITLGNFSPGVNLADASIAISPSGQYVVIYGEDTSTTAERLVIIKGA